MRSFKGLLFLIICSPPSFSELEHGGFSPLQEIFFEMDFQFLGLGGTGRNDAAEDDIRGIGDCLPRLLSQLEAELEKDSTELLMSQGDTAGSNPILEHSVSDSDVLCPS